MNGERDGLARSLQTRLARHAKAIGVDPNLLLTRYSIDRLFMVFFAITGLESACLINTLLSYSWFARYSRFELSPLSLGISNPCFR